MLFEFSEITVPEIPNKLEGESFERHKRSLSSKMFDQRGTVFTEQASHDGPWKPLAPATMRERQSRLGRGGNGSVRILTDTGLLRQSFTPQTGPGNAFKHVEVGDDFVRNVSNVAYARIHNEGGTILRQNKDHIGRSGQLVVRSKQMFKHYTGGVRAGQIHFASKKDIARGQGRDFEILERDVKTHGVGSYITIPARPFDQFTDANEEALAELTESYLNGKLR